MLAEAIIDLATLLVRWVPIRAELIHEYEQGVFWWKGKARKCLKEPGIYWYVPWISDISIESIKVQEVETELQVLEDPDGKARSISFGIQYEVVDLLLHQTCVTDFDDSLLNLVERIACEVHQSGEANPLRSLRRKVREQCREWGVKVHRLGYINNARVRPLHLLQNE